VSQLSFDVDADGDDDDGPGVVRVRVECDGGARGNPGPAAIGAVVTDARDGRVLGTVSEYIGSTTNNVAEYRAAIAGLERALEVGAREVDLRADSLLVVNQILGKWKVKQAHLKPLHESAKALLARFRSSSVEHVGRDANVDADMLVNAALDAHMAG
jgi:ribonuclease HI